MEKNKIYFKKALGKSGRPYTCILVDLGYREIVLTFDSSVCAEILDLSARELAALPVGEWEIGEIFAAELGKEIAAKDDGGKK